MVFPDIPLSGIIAKSNNRDPNGCDPVCGRIIIVSHETADLRKNPHLDSPPG